MGKTRLVTIQCDQEFVKCAVGLAGTRVALRGSNSEDKHYYCVELCQFGQPTVQLAYATRGNNR
jgi:hypothetical protein